MKLRSIKTKVIFSVLLMFFLIFPAFAYMAIFYFKYNAKKSVQAQQSELVNKLADEINTKMVMLTRVLKTSADHMSDNDFTDHDSAIKYLRKHVSLTSLYDDNIIIFDAQGRLLGETGDGSQARVYMSFLWRDYIKVPMATHRMYISAPLRAAASTKLKLPMVVICAPVVKDGKLIGFITGSVNLFKKNIFDNSSFTHLDNKGWIYLVDSGGNVIMHPDRSKIVSPMDNIENPYINKMMQMKNGSMEYKDGKNNIIEASFSHIPLTNWTLVANYEADNIFKSIERAESTLIYIVFCGAFFVFFMLRLIMKSLVTPLISLRDQVIDLKKTHSRRKMIEVESNDEIKDTANAFNNLLEEIYDGRDRLNKNNEILQTVCDFSNDWIFLVNADGHMEYFSPVASDITGYSMAELSDYPEFYEQIIHPDDYEVWLKAEQYSRLHQDAYSADIRIICKDGTQKWLEMYCKGIYENDRLVGIRGAYKDITDTKQAENRLLESNWKYSILIQNSDSPIIITESDFRIYEFNDKAYKLISCEIGSDFLMCIGVSSEQIKTRFMENPKTRSIDTESDVVVFGDVAHYLWHINKMTTDSGKISGYMVVGIDITAKVKKNAELSKMAVKTEISKYTAHMEAIIKSVSDGIISVDRHFRLSCYNDVAEQLFGITSDDIGKPLENINAFFADTLSGLVRKTIRKNTAFKGLRAIADINGTNHELKLTVTPLLDSEDRHFGALAVICDETGLKTEQDVHVFENIVGQSRKMTELFSMMSSLADVDSTVLILGESGTGKELVANGIHSTGKRSDKPFIKLNCSAIPENLLESELFGHVKGSFTGAIKDKTGKFEAANGGTIFLDEIGDISPNIQVKLLRVLQEKEIEIIGRNDPVKIDVRVIAATNRDLKEMVAKGEFREDLYYRLKVVTVTVPPLRERREDILPLLSFFIARFNQKLGKTIIDAADDVKDMLCSYEWFGNVRELEHITEYACLMASTSFITTEDLPADFMSKPGDASEEKEKIERALADAKGYKAKAARLLGMSRATLYRKLQDYNIEY